VVDHILARRNIPRLNLLGWSWGTTLMATYTTQNPAKVERLALYAPVWIRQTASLVQTGAGPLGAYRTVKREQALGRWMTGAPEDRRRRSFPPAGSTSGRRNLRQRPRRLQDEPAGAACAERRHGGRQRILRRRQPYYDPAKITVPTLLVVAE